MNQDNRKTGRNKTEQHRNETALKFIAEATAAGFKVDHYNYAGRYAPCVWCDNREQFDELKAALGWKTDHGLKGCRISYVSLGKNFIVLPFWGKLIAAPSNSP